MLFFPIITAIMLVITDQVTKHIMVNLFEGRTESITVIPGVLSFWHVDNDGAGFSILSGKTTFLIIFTVVLLVAVGYLFFSRRLHSRLSDWGLALIFSGGIGNLIDRISRSGRVVDFIKTDFINFPIFNVADICITVGAGIIILVFILDIIKENRQKKGFQDGEN